MKVIYTDWNGDIEIKVGTVKEAVKEIIDVTSWIESEEKDVAYELFVEDLKEVTELGLLERTIDQYINKHWEGSVSIEIK